MSVGFGQVKVKGCGKEAGKMHGRRALRLTRRGDFGPAARRVHRYFRPDLLCSKGIGRQMPTPVQPGRIVCIIHLKLSPFL
jgi:hypothetical protein